MNHNIFRIFSGTVQGLFKDCLGFVQDSTLFCTQYFYVILRIETKRNFFFQFGVPKIGDAKFVEIFEFYLYDRYHRISKPNDLLVRYPVTSSAYVHLSNKNKNPKRPIPTRNRMTLFRQFLNGNEQHRLQSYQRFVKKYFVLKRSESVLLPKEKQYEILKNRSRLLG